MNKINNETRSIMKKKSDMAAQSNFDYQKLAYHHEQFIPCTFTNNKEDIKIEYDINDLFPITKIRNDSKENRLAILIDAIKLVKYRYEYQFSLNPDNLYCDYSNRIYILERDVYKKGQTFDENNFISECKALIGYLLQKKYSFDNYFNGGMDLLRKNPFLSEIEKFETIEEIKNFLIEEYKKEAFLNANKKISVDKNKAKILKAYAIIATVFVIAIAAVLGYWKLEILPVKDAIIASDIAYITEDYVQLIDSLKEVDTSKLDSYHKYTLALSYVKNENLTNEQRDNIISKLSINTDSRILCYWISIGRMDVTEAENIAMQCSDDELLLYAYLKEENLLETDANMDGEEKANRIDSVKKKIEDLSSKYETEE